MNFQFIQVQPQPDVMYVTQRAEQTPPPAVVYVTQDGVPLQTVSTPAAPLPSHPAAAFLCRPCTTMPLPSVQQAAPPQMILLANPAAVEHPQAPHAPQAAHAVAFDALSAAAFTQPHPAAAHPVALKVFPLAAPAAAPAAAIMSAAGGARGTPGGEARVAKPKAASTVLRVSAKTPVPGLAGAMSKRVRLEGGERLILEAMGPSSVAKSVRAFHLAASFLKEVGQHVSAHCEHMYAHDRMGNATPQQLGIRLVVQGTSAVGVPAEPRVTAHSAVGRTAAWVAELGLQAAEDGSTFCVSLGSTDAAINASVKALALAGKRLEAEGIKLTVQPSTEGMDAKSPPREGQVLVFIVFASRVSRSLASSGATGTTGGGGGKSSVWSGDRWTAAGTNSSDSPTASSASPHDYAAAGDAAAAAAAATAAAAGNRTQQQQLGKGTTGAHAAETLRVSAKTPVAGLAGAAAKRVRGGRSVVLEAMGPTSVAHGARAFGLAASFLRDEGLHVRGRCEYNSVARPGGTASQQLMRVHIEGCSEAGCYEEPIVSADGGTVTRMCGRIRACARSNAEEGKSFCINLGSTDTSVNTSVKALTLARTQLEEEGIDIAVQPATATGVDTPTAPDGQCLVFVVFCSKREGN